MKKLLSRITLVLALIPILFSYACVAKPQKVIIESDTYVVINVPDDVADNTTLEDYMKTLSSKISFTVENGMVTTINEVSSIPNGNGYWMLYTTDEENSNKAWGEIDYNGTNYASSTLGVETLKVKKGESYIWLYEQF